MRKMKEIICKYVEVDPDTITEDSRFIEDLGFNSYDIMCMLGDAEAEFDIRDRPGGDTQMQDRGRTGQVFRRSYQ